MTDNLTREKRIKVMSSIRGKNTRPELIMRKLLWSKGKRYRIHDRSVFGTPDISNKKKRVAVFVDGCFWHGCEKCYRPPRTNSDFWAKKIESNKNRRKQVMSKLENDNWKVFQVWEHEIIKNPQPLVATIMLAL